MPPAQKEAARAALGAAAAIVSQSGATVLTRINVDSALVEDDRQVTVILSIRATMLPKVESVRGVKTLDAHIGAIESVRSGVLGLFDDRGAAQEWDLLARTRIEVLTWNA